MTKQNILSNRDLTIAKFKAAFYLSIQFDLTHGDNYENEVDKWAKILADELLAALRAPELPEKLPVAKRESKRTPRDYYARGFNEAIERMSRR